MIDSQGGWVVSDMGRILILGGTTEAGRLAEALHAAGWPGVYSYAGRTAAPVAQPLPTRVGGFGGAEGLAAYLAREEIAAVIDATHPFAAQMSGNAIKACAATNTPLLAVERVPWEPGDQDDWTPVPDIAAAVRALPESPTVVFLAIGRQHLAPFAQRPEHDYLLRLVDRPGATLPLKGAKVVVARGPFTASDDLALLRTHRVGCIVSKNAGGTGARAKLDAARKLGLPVIMIERPAIPPRERVETVAEVLNWLTHTARLGV